MCVYMCVYVCVYIVCVRVRTVTLTVLSHQELTQRVASLRHESEALALCHQETLTKLQDEATTKEKVSSSAIVTLRHAEND